jgi:hypothetical protein
MSREYEAVEMQRPLVLNQWMRLDGFQFPDQPAAKPYGRQSCLV